MSKREGSSSTSAKYLRTPTTKKSKSDFSENTTMVLDQTQQNTPIAGSSDTNAGSSNISSRQSHSRRPSFFCVGPNDWHGPRYVNPSTSPRTYCSRAKYRDAAVSVLVADESNLSEDVAFDETGKLRNDRDKCKHR